MPPANEFTAAVEALADAFAAGPSELLTRAQSARLLSVGRTAFAALAARTDFPLPVELVAGVTHYRRADLLAWVRKRPNRRTVPARGGRRDKSRTTTLQPRTQE